jgi:hypothetical protein
MRKLFLLFVFIGILSSACKTVHQTKTRVEGEKTSTADLLKKLEQPDIPYKWFFAKAKIQIEDSHNDNTVNAVIRMKKDSVIWISLNALVGIEVSRMLITPDSVKMLDRFNKRYYARSFSYVQQMTGVDDLNFAQLQRMIMGNDMQAMDPTKTEVVKTDSSYQVNSHESQIESVIWINALNFTMAKKELKNKVINQSYEMDYDDYRLLADRLFSYRRRVRLATKEVYNLNIEYQKVTLDEPQKFPFNVPDKYLVVKPETKEEKK